MWYFLSADPVPGAGSISTDSTAVTEVLDDCNPDSVQTVTEGWTVNRTE